MLQLGSVAYANARPLLEGLGEEPGVRLTLATPAVLEDRLAAGDLDAALVPSIAWFRNPARVLVPEGCIASRGEVESVALFGRRRPGPGGRVLLDESSRTSSALARILLEGPLGAPGVRYDTCPPGVDPREVDADAVLLIGDRALVLDRAGLEVTDLGIAWTSWTGLPFVWAAWIARDEAAAEAAAPVLRAARQRGRERREAIVAREAERLGLERDRMERYLGERIRYDHGEEEQRGLERYREECGRAGEI